MPSKYKSKWRSMRGRKSLEAGNHKRSRQVVCGRCGKTYYVGAGKKAPQKCSECENK